MIGILVATDIELAAIQDTMDIQNTKEIAGRSFFYGTIQEQEVVLAQTGVGKTHAAMTTTILCLQEKVDLLINTGTAGGLKENQQVLDVVIGKKVIQADFDTSPIDGKDGYGLHYNLDSKALEKAEVVAKEIGLQVHVGTIATQDKFMSRPEDFQTLLELFPEVICCEMEAGAVGQVAHDFGVDTILIRCLSDVVVHEDNSMEYLEYAQIASKQVARWIQNFL